MVDTRTSPSAHEGSQTRPVLEDTMNLLQVDSPTAELAYAMELWRADSSIAGPAGVVHVEVMMEEVVVALVFVKQTDAPKMASMTFHDAHNEDGAINAVILTFVAYYW